MPYPRVYQPELHPHLIKGLFHESKLRKMPMTRILNDIVTRALDNTEGMKLARRELQQGAHDPVAS